MTYYAFRRCQGHRKLTLAKPSGCSHVCQKKLCKVPFSVSAPVRMDGFGSDFSAGGSGGKMDTGTIMEQVKVQIAVANAQELLQVS